MIERGFTKVCQLGSGQYFCIKKFEEGIELRVYKQLQNLQYIQYEGKITSLKNHQALNNKFENMEKLFDFLKSSENIKFETSKQLLIILQKQGQSTQIPMESKTIQKNKGINNLQTLKKELINKKTLQLKQLPDLLIKLLELIQWLALEVKNLKEQSKQATKSLQTLKRQKPTDSKELSNQNEIRSASMIKFAPQSSEKFRESDSTGNTQSKYLTQPSQSKKKTKVTPVLNFVNFDNQTSQDLEIYKHIIKNKNSKKNVVVYSSIIQIPRHQQYILIFKFNKINDEIFLGLRHSRTNNRFFIGNKRYFYQCIDKQQLSFDDLERGFNQEQEVMMTVNFKNGSIRWSVNNEQIISVAQNCLKSAGWIVTIDMRKEGDEVQIFQKTP